MGAFTAKASTDPFIGVLINSIHKAGDIVFIRCLRSLARHAGAPCKLDKPR